MLDIWTYALGIMYSPGPVNLLSLNGGIQGHTRHHLGFFLGVACAMLILFISLSYLGGYMINDAILPYVALPGCSYILYLAWKLLRSPVTLKQDSPSVLSFKNGLLIQLLNPKGMIATLPIATIQFPAQGITGGQILYWSVALALFAGCAPGSYSVIGAVVGKHLLNAVWLQRIQQILALLLIYAALSIGYEHIYKIW
ncbi:LysE family translocator [Vibrio mangrovi]|uniref:Cysteine/O-acetylserine efflux protein n=1 Tax=Vibrio mangrovi TaxID=474394 RepID=A0A1Y6IWY8_9VIBR|nr:LysE family transporter [Vibrio mangrovi]MDW6001425.1 LysE family transporter [Vibrio mangrovi]SMS00553.1 Cysteine/O-acetylserine efflux protein [Vibrio mangrovi]